MIWLIAIEEASDEIGNDTGFCFKFQNNLWTVYDELEIMY